MWLEGSLKCVADPDDPHCKGVSLLLRRLELIRVLSNVTHLLYDFILTEIEMYCHILELELFLEELTSDLSSLLGVFPLPISQQYGL